MTDDIRYGATPEEWDLVIGWGLTGDMLPVVSNPNAEISENSGMKSLGKTPSVYTTDRKVVGISKWTQRTALPKAVENWKKEPDYGICIQTRRLRAFDIDVDDPEKAHAIRALILSRLDGPVRYRAGTGKSLIPFILEGEYGKRVVKVGGGIIEVLCNGQQFIAAGMHTSGTRYAWENCHIPLPKLSVDDFEQLYSELVATFAIAPPTEGHVRKTGGAEAGEATDDTATLLHEKGLVLGGKPGMLYIHCPWKDDHGADTGDTQTSYMIAGTQGYDQGKFHCFDAACSEHTQMDFRAAINVGGVELFTPLDEGAAEGEPNVSSARAVNTGVPGVKNGSSTEGVRLPPLDRDKKGKAEASRSNLELILKCHGKTGYELRFDNFIDDILLTKEGKARRLIEEDYANLAMALERGVPMEHIPAALLREMLYLVARGNQFDSGIEWLAALEWDNVPRIECFLVDCFGAKDTPYTRAVGRYLWTALAGRMLKPGVKADMVPVLVGPQGLGKSRGVEIMPPNPLWTTAISLDERDDDLARKMVGRCIIEIGELRGLNSREGEAIKQFITRTEDEWIPKYHERRRAYPRRCVFVGTTNETEFLADTTGNRRWLPVEVVKANWDKIAADRDQLWAEGKALFELLGIEFGDAERLAVAEHAQYRVTDLWADRLDEWLQNPDPLDGGIAPCKREFLTSQEIILYGLRLDENTFSRSGADAKRLIRIMQERGWTKKRLRDGDNRARVWLKS